MIPERFIQIIRLDVKCTQKVIDNYIRDRHQLKVKMEAKWYERIFQIESMMALIIRKSTIYFYVCQSILYLRKKCD